MGNWTPGPWRFLEEGWAESMHGRCEPLTICSRNNVDLAIVFSADDSTVSTTREQAIANARLIATAPDLLAALEILIANARLIPDPDMAGATDCYAVPMDDIDAARAAIRKAKGLSPVQEKQK